LLFPRIVRQWELVPTSSNRTGTERSRTERAFHRGTIFQLRGWRRLALFLIGGLLRLYCRSLRLHVSETEIQEFEKAARRAPMVVITWHNRSLLIPEITRQCYDPRRVSCLVSPSRMAAWEAAFYEWVGMRPVRGSSSRRAIAATRQLLAEYREGQSLGISPDGPSGPMYSWQRGATMLARKTDAPILLVCADAHFAWRLKTWDRHFIPLPFTRVNVRFRSLLPYSEQGYESDEEAAGRMRKQFLEITRDPFPSPSQVERAVDSDLQSGSASR